MTGNGVLGVCAGGLPETWEVAGSGNTAHACYLPARKPLRATSLGLRPAFRPMSARELHDVHPAPVVPTDASSRR